MTAAPDTNAGAVRTTRLVAQLLGRQRAGSPEEVVRRLVAVQGQDARAFRLAVRARATGSTAASVDDALTEYRTLLVSWLCRGTLHLVGAADYWWLHELVAHRQLTGNRTRLAQLGVMEAQIDAAVDVIVAEVARQPKSRAELGAAVDDAGLPTEGQILVHLLVAASLRAHLVRGPVVGAEHCFVDAERWLSRPRRVPEGDEALAVFARRYLAGHGPASARDLAAFGGITLGDARRGFAAIEDETRRLGGDTTCLAGQVVEDTPPPPRLLGMFDPVLHGWADRSFVLGAYPGVVTTNGMFRATALVDGQVAGTWTMPAGVVTVRLAAPVPADVRAALEDEGADVLRFLGKAAAPVQVAGPGA